jgi:hypothetical protein
MWAGLTRKLSLTIVAAASVLSVQPASAGCGCPCGFPGACGAWAEPYAYGAYVTAPLQPTFYVEQGPTYAAVLVAPEDAQRWLVFPHPDPHPYIHTWYGPHYWWTTQLAADPSTRLPRARYTSRHHRNW